MIGTSHEMNAAVAGGSKSILEIAHASNCGSRRGVYDGEKINKLQCDCGAYCAVLNPTDEVLFEKAMKEFQKTPIMALEPVPECDHQELTHALRLIAKHVEANGAAWAKSVALQALEESGHP